MKFLTSEFPAVVSAAECRDESMAEARGWKLSGSRDGAVAFVKTAREMNRLALRKLKVGRARKMRTPPKLMDVSHEIGVVIDRALAAGVAIGDGNVIDLLADNLPDSISLADLRAALVTSKYSGRWPRAERVR